MIKNWITKAFELLEYTLNPMPHEINELDWKENLSPNNKKLSQHLSAFANQPGGGYMVFGLEDKTANLVGVTQQSAEAIIQKLSSICRDSVLTANYWTRK
ncbi:AlbA family DNA-binding domain-containing protein [Runella limosa]|uniref:AlbA family DNA-binding domain-containing protein n=1 Tax=Runella limosa TaxID=370978 RepID=UPI00048F950B|nr:ATP-binding protein [Runella limosa]